MASCLGPRSRNKKVIAAFVGITLLGCLLWFSTGQTTPRRRVWPPVLRTSNGGDGHSPALTTVHVSHAPVQHNGSSPISTAPRVEEQLSCKHLCSISPTELASMEVALRNIPGSADELQRLILDSTYTNTCRGLLLLLLARLGDVGTLQHVNVDVPAVYWAIATCVSHGARSTSAHDFWSACLSQHYGIPVALGEWTSYEDVGDQAIVLEASGGSPSTERAQDLQMLIGSASSPDAAEKLLRLAEQTSKEEEQAYIVEIVAAMLPNSPTIKTALWAGFSRLGVSGQYVVLEASERAFEPEDARRLTEVAAWGTTGEIRLRAVKILERRSLSSQDARNALVFLSEMEGGDILVRNAASAALKTTPR